MPIDAEIHARVKDGFERLFTCARCGHRVLAQVVASGYARAPESRWSSEGGEWERAAEEARYDAAGKAEVALSLARCPRCRRVSVAAWVQHLIFTLLKVALLMAIIAGASLAIGTWLAVLALIAIVPVFAVVTLLIVDRVRRVRFVTRPPLR
jgi:hypothetical protein